MKGNPYVDTRRWWVKWLAPFVLAVSALAVLLDGHMWISILLIANALVAHAEGYATALLMRRRS